MNRVDIINWFIKKYNYKSYLEIGVDNPNNCFNKIDIENKIGIDPVKGGTFKMTSDDFFSINRDKFDIIFIDGLHIEYQVETDIDNSLMCFNINGTVVIHDLNPKNELEQKTPREVGVWTGNGWKAWAKFRMRDDLYMYTIDTDHGVGIIRKGAQIPLENKYTTFEEFITFKSEILNFMEIH